MSSNPRLVRVGAVALVFALGLAAWKAGLLGRVSEPATLGRELVALGGLGYLAFIVSYALFQPFGVPGTVFIFAAPLIWPWPVAFGLSMVGTMCASVIGFSFARFVAREFVSARIPPRFHRYDEALARRAFATVFTMRLVFWMPPLLHAFFGVSRVPFWTHFAGSLLGYVVPLLLVSYFGRRVFDAARALPPAAWLGVLGLVLLVALVTWALRARPSKEDAA